MVAFAGLMDKDEFISVGLKEKQEMMLLVQEWVAHINPDFKRFRFF